MASTAGGCLGLFTASIASRIMGRMGSKVSTSDFLSSRDRILTPSSFIGQSLLVDEDVENWLFACRPLSPKPMLSVGFALHSLRLWELPCLQTVSPFAEEKVGEFWYFRQDAARLLLLDDAEFKRCYPNSLPLLTRTNYGIYVRNSVSFLNGEPPTLRWPDYSAHTDGLAAAISDAKLPLGTTVYVSGISSTVRDLILDSLMRYTGQMEVEFSLKAYSRFLKGNFEWSNRFGNRFNLGDEIEKLANSDLGNGACGGIHKVQALATWINNTSNQSEKNSMRVSEALRTVATKLESTQLKSGGYSILSIPGNSSEHLLNAEGEFFSSLRATGHHLEWILEVPPELAPSFESIRAAVDFLRNSIVHLTPQACYRHHTLLTHCARAIALIFHFGKLEASL